MSPYLFPLVPLIGAVVLVGVYAVCRKYQLNEEALAQRDRREHARNEALKSLALEFPTIPDRKPTRPRGERERRKA